MSRLSSLFLLAVLGVVLPVRAQAQQNLFNVPSSSVTARHGVFVQEQVNTTRPAGTSSTTVDIGLGRGVDIGFNVFDVAFYEPQGHDLPMFFLANAQAVLDPVPALRIAFGTQEGVTTMHGVTRWAGFGYTSLRYEAHEGRFGRYLVGAYACSRGYGGRGTHVGGLLGFELPVAGDHLSLMADWMVGKNDLGVAVLGMQIGLGHGGHTQISLGAQLPSPGSHNAYGAVFELTFVPHGRVAMHPPMPMTGVMGARHHG